MKFNLSLKDTHLEVIDELKLKHSDTSSEEIVKKYVEVALKYGLQPSILANSFVLSRPFVASALIGATTISHLQENLKSIDTKLGSEIIDEINNIHLSDPNPCV